MSRSRVQPVRTIHDNQTITAYHDSVAHIATGAFHWGDGFHLSPYEAFVIEVWNTIAQTTPGAIVGLLLKCQTFYERISATRNPRNANEPWGDFPLALIGQGATTFTAIPTAGQAVSTTSVSTLTAPQLLQSFIVVPPFPCGLVRFGLQATSGTNDGNLVVALKGKF